jgi:hypothetical protein
VREILQPPELLPNGAEPGKLVVFEQVYHERPDFGTKGIESRYCRWLTTDRPWHEDEFEVGQEWTPVQVGRITQAGEVVVENLEGTDFLEVPTEVRRQQTLLRVLDVAFLEADESPAAIRGRLEVLPGESARFRPKRGQTIYVRCQDPGQTAKLRTTTIPA